MPKFKINWEMSGTCEVDADDEVEAIDIAESSLETLDHTMLDSIDVDDIDVSIGDDDD